MLYKADSPRSPLAKGNKKLSLIDEKEGVFRSSPSDLEILWSHQVLVQQFISWLNAAGIAPLTMKSYGATLGRFCEFLKHYHGKEITMDDIVGVNITDVRAFLADRRDQNISHASNAQCLSALKTFYRFIIAQGHTLSWSLQLLRRPRLPRTFPRPLDGAQLAPLMRAPDVGGHWVEWRNYAALVLLYATGLRIQEILNLNHGHWGNATDISVVCKGGKNRLVPVLPIARKAVDIYLSKVPHLNTGPETPLFLGEKGKRLQAAILQKHLRHLRPTYGLPEHVTPHSFRHSFASHLLDSGVSLRDVQELLGHTSVRATQIYTQNTQGHLQELYRAAHPGMGHKQAQPTVEIQDSLDLCDDPNVDDPE